jgi:hypothetical protein
MCQVPAQLATDINAAAQSTVISLSGINPVNCPEIDMDEIWTGGKLIFSDSPETPTSHGKLYMDTSVPATAGTDYHRIYLYHVNGKTSGKMKFTVLIKNLGSGTATLQVQKKGTAGPSTNFLYTGKLAYNRWLTSAPSTAVNVAAGATVRLDSIFDATQASPGYLMHGIWDYSMTETHQVTIVALDQNDDPLTVGPTLPLLARDTHQRGTFPHCDKIFDTGVGVVFDTVQDIESFPLAGGGVNDTNAVGTDATDGTAMTLAGNYGINYRMHLQTVSSDGRKLGILVNPRGGNWGGSTFVMPGILAGGKFLIPDTSGFTGDNTKGAVLGKWNPSTGLSIWCQFMPTGGSSFPVRFVFVPF